MAEELDDLRLLATEAAPPVESEPKADAPAASAPPAESAPNLHSPQCGTDQQVTTARESHHGFSFLKLFSNVGHWLTRGSQWLSSVQAWTSRQGDSKRQSENITTPPRSEIDTNEPAAPEVEPQRRPAEAAAPFPDLGQRYEVKAELGFGGFGRVFRVYDRRLQREVAVKVALVAAEGRDALLREARQAASLRHRNIITVHDVIELDDGSVAVSMEFIPGGSLRDALTRRGRFSALEAAKIVQQIATGLQVAHDKLLTHRDMKPENVLLDADSIAKVLDFGMALCAAQISDDTLSHGGTLPYMSPEQVRREIDHLDGRTDVWALGVILYELLTGERPFQGVDRAATREAIKNDRPIAPSKRVRGIPNSLERICLRCLDKDRDQRMPSAAELAEQLGRFQRMIAFRRTLSYLGLAVVLTLTVAAGATYAVNPELFYPPPAPPMPLAPMPPAPLVPGANIPRFDPAGRENLLVREPMRFCFLPKEFDNPEMLPSWNHDTGEVTFQNNSASVLMAQDAEAHVQHIHLEGSVKDWQSGIGIYFHLRKVWDELDRVADQIETGFVVWVGRRHESDRLSLRIQEVVFLPLMIPRGRMEFHRYFFEKELVPPPGQEISLDLNFVDGLLLVDLNGEATVDHAEALKQKESYGTDYPELWEQPATVGIFGYGRRVTVTNLSVR